MSHFGSIDSGLKAAKGHIQQLGKPATLRWRYTRLYPSNLLLQERVLSIRSEHQADDNHLRAALGVLALPSYDHAACPPGRVRGLTEGICGQQPSGRHVLADMENTD